MKILVTTLGLLSLLLAIHASPLPLSSSYELLHSRCHVKGGKVTATFTVKSDFTEFGGVLMVAFDWYGASELHPKTTHSTPTTKTWEVHEHVRSTIHRIDLRIYYKTGHMAKAFPCTVDDVKIETDHTSIFWYAERVYRQSDWILLAKLVLYIFVGISLATYIAAKFTVHIRLFGEVAINNHKV
ncbi:Cy184 [Cynomolgus cytomegalovirus]|nr:Cy184 [Cynomolgus cytomegalovirus]